MEWDPVAIAKHAQQFGEERFREAIRAEVEQQLHS
jgi:hypothetical protein